MLIVLFGVKLLAALVVSFVFLVIKSSVLQTADTHIVEHSAAKEPDM